MKGSTAAQLCAASLTALLLFPAAVTEAARKAPKKAAAQAVSQAVAHGAPAPQVEKALSQVFDAIEHSKFDLALERVEALLKTNPNPTDAEIRHSLEGNFCRCTGYHNIVKAVQHAAGLMADKQVAPAAADD